MHYKVIATPIIRDDLIPEASIEQTVLVDRVLSKVESIVGFGKRYSRKLD